MPDDEGKWCVVIIAIAGGRRLLGPGSEGCSKQGAKRNTLELAKERHDEELYPIRK
jgi:hypothetical protein